MAVSGKAFEERFKQDWMKSFPDGLIVRLYDTTSGYLNIKNICDLLFGAVDLFYVLLIFLPLYPDTVNGFIYSVSLLNYTEISSFNKTIYWVMFLALLLIGAIKIMFIKIRKEKVNKAVTVVSVFLNILIVLLFAITREVYALILVFLFLIIKGLLIYKYLKVS